VLHDHLDGGLRPLTILELAEAQEYGGLPEATNPPWRLGSIRVNLALWRRISVPLNRPCR
jgi:hypothetical protein